MTHNFFPRTLLIFLLWGIICPVTDLLAAHYDPDEILVRRCLDFKVTGDGNSPEWNKAEWVILTKRSETPVNYGTKVKVMYSEKGIYFLFDCEDSKITATIKADNQDLWFEDVVEVFLWPDETYTTYFEYELSPLNYELPIIIPNFNGKFLGWLPWHYEGERKIQHATSVTGGKKKSMSSITGWKAEFFIPYVVLTPLNNVPPVSGIVWRGNMYRVDYDAGNTSYSWQKTYKTFHDYKNFGRLRFE